MNRRKLVIDIETILAKAKPPITNDCCIYRVPYDIREVNIDAYTPKCISIGPLHHYDQRLHNMEKYKEVFFKQFVARARTNLEDLINTVEKVEPKLRSSYSVNLEMNTDELVKVILVDVCFIVELFYKARYNEWTYYDRNIFTPKLWDGIFSDLLLLENQVPYFIVEELYNLAFSSQSPTFLELSINFFWQYNQQELEPNFTICHFTDLLRKFHLKQSVPDRKDNYSKHIPTASAYHEAGVKFKTNESKCLLDLQFSGRCLKIPHIVVDDKTEMLFRNMMAFEQCHYPYDGYISDYVSVMDFLINTGKDVDVLVKSGIILNWLGDNNDVADLFNSLCKNVVMCNFNSQYFDVFDKLDAFCNTQSRKLRATLRRDYCNTPWRTLATCAAISVLLFTFTQTVCSIIQVV